MNIAIVTLFGKDNIGNRLQHLALQETILTNCNIIGNEQINTISYIYDMPNSYPARNICKIIVKRVLGIFGVKKYRDSRIRNQIKYERRAKKFSIFTDTYIRNKKKVKIENPIIENTEIAAAVVGSDQVWHHWGFANGELEYFYLDFIPPEKRISYAASFGFSAIPDKDYEIHCRGLKNMRFLSCREESMVGIIDNTVGRKAQLVLDPTLLLSIDVWEKYVKKPENRLPEKYILVYYLGQKTDDYKKMVLYLCRRYSYEIVDIYDLESRFYYTTPDEFLYLVKNAAFIVTDSFHGTVFSILNHKRFWVVRRTEKCMEDMFDRIDSLLGIFDIKESIFDNKEKDDILTLEPPVIDYEKVERILKIKREESIKFLVDGIRACIE